MRKSTHLALAVFAAASLAHPLGSHAQSATKVARVGFLGTGPSPASESFREGLRGLGWVEGENLVIEWRWTYGRSELNAEYARELARLHVDVILAPTAVQVEEARKAAPSTPIVFCCHADPVGNGHAASLERPGGNMTGVATFQEESLRKRLELVKEAFPGISRVGVLRHPGYPEHDRALVTLRESGTRLGMVMIAADAQSRADFETAFDALSKARAEAVIVLGTPITYFDRQRLAELALKHRLASIHTTSEYVSAGALMSFGININYVMRRAASFVDRILKGAKPGELPIEQAVTFELVVNKKTAAALGIQIPQPILLRATEVIEWSATGTVPIVMQSSGYPVEAELAKSLARPGGNVTGLTLYTGGGVLFGNATLPVDVSAPKATQSGAQF